MKKIRCPYCGFDCIKYGKTRIGRQRWRCKECHQVFTKPYDHTNSDFRLFLQWLFSKNVQKDMPVPVVIFAEKQLNFGNFGLYHLKLKLKARLYSLMVFT